MDDQATQISELFAAPKGNLNLVVNLGGAKIYSSPTLKLNFLKAMTKVSRVAPVANTLAKLIMKNEFIPCYLTDRIYKTILKKQPPSLKGIVGHTFGKLILVYVDNEANIFGFASNNQLSITTLHELIHKAANQFPGNFFQTFKRDLTLFYGFYWNTIFSLKKNEINMKEIEELSRFIFMTSRKSLGSNKFLSDYHRRLLETFGDKTTLSSETFQKLVTDYIVLIKIIWKVSSAGLPSLVEKACYANRNLIAPLYTAYKAVFGINVKHIKELCYQELFAPDEIISLPALVKRPDQKVYKMVNKL